MTTRSTVIPQKALTQAAATKEQLKPLTVDSCNSPGLYLRPGVYFQRYWKPPRLVIETGV